MLALDPNQTCEIKLTLDPDRAFIARYLTCRETMTYIAAVEAAKALPTPQDLQSLVAALGPVLKGWKGFPAPYSPESLLGAFMDEMTPAEVWELVVNLPSSLTLAETDKKKLVWQSQSGGAKAASTTAPASASTPPAPPAP